MADFEIVYMVESTIGDGTDKDPSRRIQEFFRKDGTKLSKHDEWELALKNTEAIVQKAKDYDKQ